MILRILAAALVTCCLFVWTTVRAEDCAIVTMSASYTHDNSVAYQDEEDPALFHLYEKAEADFSRLRPLSRYVYRKSEVRYVDGHFAATNSEAIPKTAITDQFSGLGAKQGVILQGMDRGQKVHTLFDKVIISDQVSVDATVERSQRQAGEVVSHLVVHCKDRIFTSNYQNGWIRVVSPIAGEQNKKSIAVIVDYCGSDGCTSEIDILDTD